MSILEEAIVQVRADLITKDDQLRELTQQATSEDAAAAAEAAAEVKKLKGEKSSLQAQLECKTRQLKVITRALWLLAAIWSILYLPALPRHFPVNSHP